MYLEDISLPIYIGALLLVFNNINYAHGTIEEVLFYMGFFISITIRLFSLYDSVMRWIALYPFPVSTYIADTIIILSCVIMYPFYKLYGAFVYIYEQLV